ncbi:short-chain dehydrogenase [Paramyrothecium foliicola]|nr:short-chain dehydrogenase [Paramyrothecium foliicola]
MAPRTRANILITGCSPGGMGAALAIAFHHAGHHVYATAREPAKLLPLAAYGMEILTLDIGSPASIASAVSLVSSSLPNEQGLDMLINNAAGSYSMPVADISLDAARKLFDVNVWAQIAVTQAFLPLLLRSNTARESRGEGPMIVNHTSVGSLMAVPFQSVYNASKAALAMFSATMRVELEPFGIRVVELKTGGVQTNIITNNNVNTRAGKLPEGSIYAPAREVVEQAMSQEGLKGGITAEQWASEVSALLLGDNPPLVIWRGEHAQLSRLATVLPTRTFEGMLKNMTKLDVVSKIIKDSRDQAE